MKNIIKFLCLSFFVFTNFVSCSLQKVEIGQKKARIIFENIKPSLRHFEVVSIKKYNEQGKITLEQTKDCLITYEYDNNKNLIHKTKIGKNSFDKMNDIFYETWKDELDITQTPSDYEVWYEYDNQGNQIIESYSYGPKYIMEYDSNGNQIHLIGPDNYEVISKYDKNNNLIWEKKLPYNIEVSNKYDARNNLIYTKSQNEFGTGETWYSYDSYGKLISEKNEKGTEKKYEYNNAGKLIHEYIVNEDNSDSWYDYDKKGNKIYYLASFGIEEINKYDKKGNVIYTRMNSSYAVTETVYKYNYYSNGIMKEIIQYSTNLTK